MDSMNNSFLNESDLRLSTSLSQWSGFELNLEDDERLRESNDQSTDSATMMNENREEKARTPIKSNSPKSDGENEEMFSVIREFLLEKTSQFYNDIIDAQGEKMEKTGFSMNRLRERYETLRRQIGSVVDRFGTNCIEEELNNRLKSIDAALRQLSIMKSPVSVTLSLSSDSGRSSIDEIGFSNASPLHQWRHWIDLIEAKMNRLRQRIDSCDGDQLEKRLKLQQALQSQIEQEGGHWVSLVQKYIDTWPSSHRRQIVSASIERRWHALWIKSLEWQCRLERQLRALSVCMADSSKEDGDMGEPSVKRRRLIGEVGDVDEEPSNVIPIDDACSDDVYSAASDTIPFLETEYEPLTPRSMVDTSNHDEEPISARDGGYSSGSSTVVTRFEIDDEKSKLLDIEKKKLIASNENAPCLERRTRIECSPIKDFYQMTPSEPITDDQIKIDNSLKRTDEAEQGIMDNLEQKLIDSSSKRMNDSNQRSVDTSSKTPVDTSARKFDNSGQRKKMTSRLSEDTLYVYTQPFVVPPPELTDSLLVNVGDTMSETFDMSNNENNVDDLEEILNLFRQGQERDTFEIELQELLSRRQGTVWVPLIHDDNGGQGEAIDEDEQKDGQVTPTARVETPPNTPSLIPPRLNLARNSSTGSLKRRRQDSAVVLACNMQGDRGEQSTAIDDVRGTDLGQTDIVCDENRHRNLSSTWTIESMEESWSQNHTRANRRKLRACRLRRSWSSGMQMSNGQDSNRFSVCLSKDRDSAMDFPARPNTAVSNNEDDNRGSIGICDSNGHSSIGGSDSVMTGGGETMAEQETVITDVLNASCPVWEWDDYKPPNHNESGPIDQPLLDDTMLTAFGDDYCPYLDQSLTPRTPELLSADESDQSSPFALSTRLPPIGSYDSETEESFYIMKESQNELRTTQQAVKNIQTKNKSSMQGNDYVDFLSACEYNIERLQALLSNFTRPVMKSGSNEIEVLVRNLLQDWRELALLLTRRILETPPQVMTTTKMNFRRKSNENEEFFVTLQNELRRLTRSLENIMTQGTIRSTINESNKNNSYRSLEETQEILEILKAVRRSLTAEKIRLDYILQEYDMSLNLLSNNCDAISEEVAQLRSCFEEAYTSCDSQLRGLETLRQKWTQWQQTEDLCRHVMSKLGSQISHCDVKTLKSDLAYLEERVTRVEMAFSKLLVYMPSKTLLSAVTIDETVLNDLKDRTESLRQELNALKTKVESKEANQKVPEVSRQATRRKRGYTAAIVEERKETQDQEPNKQKRSRSWRSFFCRYWPVQVCLCVLVCLNVFIFYPSCCEHMNRYWWSFESKLDYSNGPPPT